MFELEMSLEKWENKSYEDISTFDFDYVDEFGIIVCAAAEKNCCSQQDIFR